MCSSPVAAMDFPFPTWSGCLLVWKITIHKNDQWQIERNLTVAHRLLWHNWCQGLVGQSMDCILEITTFYSFFISKNRLCRNGISSLNRSYKSIQCMQFLAESVVRLMTLCWQKQINSEVDMLPLSWADVLLSLSSHCLIGDRSAYHLRHLAPTYIVHLPRCVVISASQQTTNRPKVTACETVCSLLVTVFPFLSGSSQIRCIIDFHHFLESNWPQLTMWKRA